MPQIVELGDGTQHEFPDGASPEEIQAALKALVSPPAAPAWTPPPAEQVEPEIGRARSAGRSFMAGGGIGTGQSIQGVARGVSSIQPAAMVPPGGFADMSGVRKASEEIAKRTPVEREAILAKDPVYRFGQNLVEGAKEAFPANPKFKGEFWADTIAGSAGQMVPTLAAGVVGGPLLAGAQYGTASGQAGAEESIAAGDIEDADKVFLAYLGLGAVSEAALGVPGRLLQFIQKARRAGLTKKTAINEIAKFLGVGATREAIQEGLETIGQNVTAGETFDPGRKIMEGVPTAMAAGAVLGGVAGGAAGGLGVITPQAPEGETVKEDPGAWRPTIRSRFDPVPIEPGPLGAIPFGGTSPELPPIIPPPKADEKSKEEARREVPVPDPENQRVQQAGSDQGAPQGQQTSEVQIAPVEQVRMTQFQTGTARQFLGGIKTVKDLRDLRDEWEKSPDDARQKHMLELIEERINNVVEERGGPQLTTPQTPEVINATSTEAKIQTESASPEGQPSGQPNAKPEEKAAAPVLRSNLETINHVVSLDSQGMANYVAEQRSKATPEEQSMTASANKVGRSVTTQAEVDALRAGKDRADAESEAIQKITGSPETLTEQSMQDQQNISAKGQFFNEAYGAATGTGIGAENARLIDPNYKPPFPEKVAPVVPVKTTERTPKEIKGDIQRAEIEYRRLKALGKNKLQSSNRATLEKKVSKVSNDLEALRGELSRAESEQGTGSAAGRKAVVTRLWNETAIGGDDILSWMADGAQVMSKSEAKKRLSPESWARNKELWDGAPDLPAHHNVVYGGDRLPDQVAEDAVREGRLFDDGKSTIVTQFWKALEAASRKREGAIANVKKEDAQMTREGEQLSAWQTATRAGKVPVQVSTLKKEDVLWVKGQKVAVTGIDPDNETVTVDGGEKFGTQVLRDESRIFVKKFEPSAEVDLFTPPEPKAKPEAKTLTEAVELFTEQDSEGLSNIFPAFRTEQGEITMSETHEPRIKENDPRYFDNAGFWFAFDGGRVKEVLYGDESNAINGNTEAIVDASDHGKTGLFISIRDLDTAGGDYKKALQTKVSELQKPLTGFVDELQKLVKNVASRRDWSKVPQSFQDDALKALKAELNRYLSGNSSAMITARSKLARARNFSEAEAAVLTLAAKPEPVAPKPTGDLLGGQEPFNLTGEKIKAPAPKKAVDTTGDLFGQAPPAAAAPAPAPVVPKPSEALRPLTAAEKKELSDLVLQDRAARDGNGEPLNKDQLKLYDDLMARAGQMEIPIISEKGTPNENKPAKPTPESTPGGGKPEVAGSTVPEATGAAIGTKVDNFIKNAKGQWQRIGEDGKPTGIPLNKKQSAQLEEKALLPPEEKDTRSSTEILDKAKQVKIIAPEGATFIRATDGQGRKTEQSIANLNKGGNILQDAGIVKLEAGTITKDKKFTPIPGEVKVEEVLSARQKADKLAAALEKLKLKDSISYDELLKIDPSNRRGESGFVRIFGVIPRVVNAAISLAQNILRAGGSMADAIARAMRYIRENADGDWDEAGMQGYLESKVVEIPKEKRRQVAGVRGLGDITDVENIDAIKERVRESFFDGREKVDEAQTERAWGFFRDMTDPTQRAANAEQVSVGAGGDMAPGLLRNELWDYALKMAMGGDIRLLSAMVFRNQDFQTVAVGAGNDTGASRAQRAAKERAAGRIWQMLVKLAKERAAAAGQRLGVGIEAFNNIVAEINGSPMPTELPGFETPDMPGNPNPEKETESERRTKVASNEKVARKLMNQLETRGVEWLNNKQPSEVLKIIREALAGEPFTPSSDPNKKEPIWEDPTTFTIPLRDKLIAVGVKEETAMRLAREVYAEVVARDANQRSRQIERAANAKNIASLIEALANSPYQAQSDPDWRRETAINWFLSNGLSLEQAKKATQDFDAQFVKALGDARVKLARKLLESRVNPERMTEVIRAIRAGLTDPSRDWVADIAERGGYKPLTADEQSRLIEFEQQLSDPALSPPESAEIMNEMYRIVRQKGYSTGSMIRAWAEFFVGGMLSNTRTAFVQLSPLFDQAVQFAVMSASNPRNIGNFARMMKNAVKSTMRRQFQFAWQKQAFGFVTSDIDLAHNELERVNDALQKQFDAEINPRKKAAIKARQLVIVSRFTLRLLSTMDQAQMAVALQWKLPYYASLAMQEAGLKSNDISDLIDRMTLAKQAEFDAAIDEGLEPARAQVRADHRVTQVVYDWVENVTDSEMAQMVLASAERDIYSVVGRRAPGIAESEEGMLTRHLGINWAMSKISEARGKGGEAAIGTVAVFGFLNVPLRTSRYYSSFGFYGMVRWGIDKWRTSKGKDPWWKQSHGNALQSRKMFRTAMAGSLVTTATIGWALSHSTADDDALEVKWGAYITGGGPKNKVLRDHWLKFWQPYSLNLVINGKHIYIPLTRVGEVLLPGFFPAAAIDDMKWKQKEAKAAGNPVPHGVGLVVGGLIGTFFSMSGQRGPLQTISKLWRATTGEGDPVKGVASLVASTASALIIPDKALLAQLSEMFLGPLDQSSASAIVAASIPVFGIPWQTKAVNRFNDELYDQTVWGKIARTGVPFGIKVAPTSQNMKMYEMLISKGVSAPELRRSNVEKKYGPLDDADWGKFVGISGDALKKATLPNVEGFKRSEPEQIDKFLTKAATAANNEAAEALKLERVKPAARSSGDSAGGGSRSANMSFGASSGVASSPASKVSMPIGMPGRPRVGFGSRLRGISGRLRGSSVRTRARRLVTGRLRARSGGRVRRLRLGRTSRSRVRRPRIRI